MILLLENLGSRVVSGMCPGRWALLSIFFDLLPFMWKLCHSFSLSPPKVGIMVGPIYGYRLRCLLSRLK